MAVILLIFVCLVWAGLIIANNVSTRLAQRIRGFDIFSMIPGWSLFAPNPWIYDIHLIYRDKDASGNCGSICEAPIRIPAHSRTRCIWNPDQRVSKSLLDAFNELSRLTCAGLIPPAFLKPHEIKRSFPYVMLANYVMHIDPHSAAVSRQFGIAVDCGHDGSQETKLVFVSEFHPLPKPE